VPSLSVSAGRRRRLSISLRSALYFQPCLAVDAVLVRASEREKARRVLERGTRASASRPRDGVPPPPPPPPRPARAPGRASHPHTAQAGFDPAHGALAAHVPAVPALDARLVHLAPPPFPAFAEPVRPRLALARRTTRRIDRLDQLETRLALVLVGPLGVAVPGERRVRLGHELSSSSRQARIHHGPLVVVVPPALCRARHAHDRLDRAAPEAARRRRRRRRSRSRRRPVEAAPSRRDAPLRRPRRPPRPPRRQPRAHARRAQQGRRPPPRRAPRTAPGLPRLHQLGRRPQRPALRAATATADRGRGHGPPRRGPRDAAPPRAQRPHGRRAPLDLRRAAQAAPDLHPHQARRAGLEPQGAQAEQDAQGRRPRVPPAVPAQPAARVRQMVGLRQGQPRHPRRRVRPDPPRPRAVLGPVRPALSLFLSCCNPSSCASS